MSPHPNFSLSIPVNAMISSIAPHSWITVVKYINTDWLCFQASLGQRTLFTSTWRTRRSTSREPRWSLLGWKTRNSERIWLLFLSRKQN